MVGRATAVVLVVGALACGQPAERPAPPVLPVTPSAALETAAPAPTTAATPSPTRAAVVVTYRIEVRTTDAVTADFAEVVRATLADPRGWQQAGFHLEPHDDAPHRIVLAEAAEVDALCLPYDTFGQYSCQNGPVVAINADRWRQATPQWTGDLDTYRRMLVNHEVGHLLGQRHVDCPAAGDLAPVMTQQSTELDGCVPNPWPLPSEIAVAARHDQPVAPGFGE